MYEYGEILTRVSIAMTRACECHANANECQYFYFRTITYLLYALTIPPLWVIS